METFFPHNLPENRVQMTLIHRIAHKMGVTDDRAAPHWIDLFSPIFRETWEAGVHDVETLERRIYTPDPLGWAYGDMVASILINSQDPRLTNE